MKAIMQSAYGPAEDVLRLADVDRPVPGDGEALVAVRAASIHPDVWHVVNGSPAAVRLMAGLRRPSNPIPGTDVAGVVEAVGSNVSGLTIGDDVFGETIKKNGQWTNGGAYAEYVSVAESSLALKPANVTFEQAASVPTSGLIAFRNLLIVGRMQPGQRVLINGAGGGVGMPAVQIAKAYGADVTAVDSAEKLDMLRNLGADQVIDFTQEDFTQNGERYDLILDIASNRPFSAIKPSLTPKGTYVLIGHDHYGASGRVIGSLGHFLATAAVATAQTRGRDKPDPIETRDPLVALTELLESGKVTPIVDRTYALSEVPAAIRYLEEGHARGKIVIKV
jgi:NADPH:quinone reductase-like Zn-dependent oxidoreductase